MKTAMKAILIQLRIFWAMCCNNLAIAYIGTGDLEKAEVAAAKGLELSEFYELHDTLATIYEKLDNFEGARNQYGILTYEYGPECFDEFRYLHYEAKRIKVCYNIRRTGKSDGSSERTPEKL